jgi:hypothetical protein
MPGGIACSGLVSGETSMQSLRIPLVALASVLAACTGGMEPSGLQPLTSDTPRQVSADTDVPVATSDAAFATTGAVASAGPITTDARVQFAPVIGATPEALPSLSLRLAARAGQRGVPLAQQGTGATHMMRGYFSAFSENRSTTIIYVWDVVDSTGNRVHRIQGRQQLPAGSQPGWSSVSTATMEAIADRTIDELAAWLSTRAG